MTTIHLKKARTIPISQISKVDQIWMTPKIAMMKLKDIGLGIPREEVN